MFIVAMVCCGLGALLILIGIFRLIVYACNSREDSKAKEQYMRQLEHARRIEQYSLRTGGAPDEFLVKTSGPQSPSGAPNGGFYWDDRESTARESTVGGGSTQYVIPSSHNNGHAYSYPVLVSPTNDLNRHSASYHPDTIIIDDSQSSIRGADVHF